MQSAVMEFARNVCGMEGATSSEFDEDAKYKVIDLMSDQVDVDKKGGTMRLGVYPCKVEAGTKTREVYGEDLIYERHRHRYEFNNEYRQQLTDAGLVISGTSPDGRLVESIEVKDHPFFVATQAHPELNLVQIMRIHYSAICRRNFRTKKIENRNGIHFIYYRYLYISCSQARTVCIW